MHLLMQPRIPGHPLEGVPEGVEVLRRVHDADRLTQEAGEPRRPCRRRLGLPPDVEGRPDGGFKLGSSRHEARPVAEQSQEEACLNL